MKTWKLMVRETGGRLAQTTTIQAKNVDDAMRTAKKHVRSKGFKVLGVNVMAKRERTLKVRVEG